MIIFGIDPGLDGAIALFRDGRYLAVMDLPVIARGKGKAAVNRQLDAAVFAVFLRHTRSVHADESMLAVVERVSAMPGQGSGSVFSLGDTNGVLAALAIAIEFVTPAEWKKHYRIDSHKERARAAAIERFPEAAAMMTRKCDHNRAEAILIARYGHTRFA